MAERRLFKEYKQLCKTPASVSNAQILDLRPLNPEESIFKWQAVIHKPFRDDSPYYHNGQWTLVIDADAQYPRKPPKIQFSRKTRINHPNINFETGEICLDILKDDAWSPAWNLEHLVGAILMLIDEPEPDSPLNVDSANLYRSDKTAFESVVQYTIWKENTIIAEKHDSGIKVSGDESVDNSSEEEDIEDEESGCEENGDDLKKSRDFGEETVKTSNLKSETNTSQSSSSTAPKEEVELDYIHDLGRHITEEFLKKATEVQISTPKSPQHQTSSHQLAAVHSHVSKNVAKQIEEICSKSGSRSHSPTRKAIERKPYVSQAQESFLEKIDQQVDEIRRLHERQSLVEDTVGV